MAKKAKVKSLISRNLMVRFVGMETNSSDNWVEVSPNFRIVRRTPTALKVLHARDDAVIDINRSLRNEIEHTKSGISLVKSSESE